MEEQSAKEETSKESSSSSSWGGWWDAVSKVADQVVQAYKEDLGEFVGAVAEDTSQAVEEVKSSKWVAEAKDLAVNNALVNQIVSTIATEEGDSVEHSVVPTSRFEAKLADLQRDIGTYCTNPSEEQLYGEFCKGFNISTREAQVATLLAQNKILQAQHTKLVPVVVSYEEFWKRYLFREIRLREREEERERLIQKASVVAPGEEEMPWDDDEGQPAVAKDAEPNISPIARSEAPSEMQTPTSTADTSALLLGDGWGDDFDEADLVPTPVAASAPAPVTPSTQNTTNNTTVTLTSNDSDWQGWE